MSSMVSQVSASNNYPASRASWPGASAPNRPERHSSSGPSAYLGRARSIVDDTPSWPTFVAGLRPSGAASRCSLTCESLEGILLMPSATFVQAHRYIRHCYSLRPSAFGTLVWDRNAPQKRFCERRWGGVSHDLVTRRNVLRRAIRSQCDSAQYAWPNKVPRRIARSAVL